MMMPSAAAAMGMKFLSARVLARFGYRQVLIVNTVMIGCTISMFALVGPGTPIAMIVLLSLTMGFFNSLQFSSMNTMAYADIDDSGLQHGQHHCQFDAADVDELRPGLRHADCRLVSGRSAANATASPSPARCIMPS